MFALMGFAIDLGQLYLVRGELQAAANAMALAAASHLTGNDAATDAATTAARLAIENGTGYANKYYFSGRPIGETTGNLNSEAPAPSYFQAAADAIGAEGASGGEVSGSAAKYVRVTLRAEAPLIFWSFIPLAAERKTPIDVKAVAGVSAPLCTACGIESIAVGAINPEETVDFGFVALQRYTLGYYCQGAGTPGPIGGAQYVRYLLLDRYNAEALQFPEENQQAFRIGAGGLPGTANPALGCVRIQSEEGENVWVSAAPSNCTAPVPAPVRGFVCGVAARFESTPAGACSNIADIDTLHSAYPPDTDIADVEEYAAYAGNGRRLITVPIVQTLDPAGAMVVVGFRQFLVEPNPNTTAVNADDVNGRFQAMYLGAVAPVRQGSIGGCAQQSAGPGKVVLHQ
jgi:hypothetical protein